MSRSPTDVWYQSDVAQGGEACMDEEDRQLTLWP